MIAIPFDVSSDLEGPLRLCVIDATGKVKGWEHDTTRKIMTACQQAGVATTDSEPIFVEGLDGIVSNVDASATAVLIVTHGGREPEDPNTARHLWTGKLKQFWEYLRTSGLDLNNCLVVLCVCSAFNDDMVNALCNSEVGADIVVAPDTPISRDEAEMFFPEFFKKLKPLATGKIMPQIVIELVEELNPLAGGRMHVALAGQYLKLSVADGLKGK